MRHLKKFEEMDYDQLRDQIHGDFHGSHNDMDARRNVVVKDEEEIEDDEENDDDLEKDDAGADEDNFTLEKFSAFNEKKATPAQKKARDAFAKRVSKKSDDKKDDKKSDDKKDDKKSDDKKSTLKNPKAADLNKDGKISKYEEKRGKAIQNAIEKKKEEKNK